MTQTGEFTMPEVKLGDTVYWKRHPGSSPSAAIVTAVGRTSLSLSVFVPGCHNLHVVDGSPHQDDPRVASRLDAEDGCWITIGELVGETKPTGGGADKGKK